VSALVTLIAAAAFLLRALPRWRYRDAITADTYFHLYCAGVIRHNRLRVPRQLPRVMLPHEYTYPFGYHYALALFGGAGRHWAERLTGPVFDCAALALVAWCSLANTPARQALLVIALYAFSPGFLRIGSGPRAYSGSPRTFGQFLYLAHVLSAYIGLFQDHALALALSVLAGAAVVLVAKFSVQVLLFFGIAFGLLLSPAYFVLLAGSLLLAIAISAGRAWRVLVGHWRHSHFYFSFLQKVFLYPEFHTFGAYLRAAAGIAKRALVNGEWKQATEWFFSERHPVHLLLTVFTPFLAVPLVMLEDRSLYPFERFLLVWAAAGLACFVLTKVRALLFLGEGERYLEYATFPALMLAVSYLDDRMPWLVYAFLAYCLTAAWVYFGMCRTSFARLEKAFQETEPGFAGLSAGSGAILPIGSFFWQALYRTTLPVVSIGGNIDETLLSREEFMLAYGNYPYPSADFAAIVATYDVAYVVTDRPHLAHYTERILKSPAEFFERVTPLYDSPSLLIYGVSRQ
jgi:hypothetical protein